MSNLLPNLSALDNIIGNALGAEQFFKQSGQLEQLPYQTKHAHFCLLKLEELRIQAITSVSSQLKPRSQIGIAREIVDQMFFAIDSYLIAARRSQNAVTRYLSSSPNLISLKGSLHDIYNKIIDSDPRTTDAIPPEIREMIIKYWNDSGLKLKNYRDRSEHTALITAEPVAFLNQDGQASIRLQLPANPENPSFDTLDFANGPSAVEYLHTSFGELVDFINDVIEQLIDNAMPEAQPETVRKRKALVMKFKAPIVLGPPPQGTPVPFKSRFSTH